MTARVPSYALSGDLAASVLATALIVVLVVMRQAGGGDPAPRPAEKQPGFHRQAPLGGAEAVTMLFDRRRDAAGTSIEVHDDRLVIVAAGVETGLACRDGVPGKLDGPVRVLVFRPGCLAPLLWRLDRMGIDPRLMTVPAALRSPGGDGWSAPFRRLIERSEDRARFARALASLLARSAALRAGGGVAGGDGDDGQALPSLAERARAAATGIGGAIAFLVALIVPAIAERRRLAAIARGV